jgi:hypothetical protein
MYFMKKFNGDGFEHRPRAYVVTERLAPLQAWGWKITGWAEELRTPTAVTGSGNQESAGSNDLLLLRIQKIFRGFGGFGLETGGLRGEFPGAHD